MVCFGWFLCHINHCRLFNAKSILIHINSSISNNSVYHTKAVLFQAIQFSISTQFSSFWTIDRTLSGATTPNQSGPGSDGNEEVLHIPLSSSITGTSPSDCFSVIFRTLIRRKFYTSAEKQSVYSTALANWTIYTSRLL